jgi:hypothetical protein
MSKKTRPREEVVKFAQFMELKLRENDHKGGWKDCGFHWLLDRLNQERIELEHAFDKIRSDCGMLPGSTIENNTVKIDPEKCMKECADVANFAMMIFDLLSADPDKTEHEWRHGSAVFGSWDTP